MKYTQEKLENLNKLCEMFDEVVIDHLEQYGIIDGVKFNFVDGSIFNNFYPSVRHMHCLGYTLLIPTNIIDLQDYISAKLIKEVNSIVEIDFNLYKNYKVNGINYSLVMEDDDYLLKINEKVYMIFREYSNNFNVMHLFNEKQAPVMAHFINYVTEQVN